MQVLKPFVLCDLCRNLSWIFLLGEWQMQLSRPQLRALRQKQQKAKDEGGQSAVDGGDKGKNMVC